MATLELACAIEGDYLAHGAAMLHSVLEHRDGLDVRAHLLHGPELDLAGAARVREMVEHAGGELVLHHVPDEQTEGLPVLGFTRRATWYRIFLPDLLGELDKVLFLDADLIVCDALAPLWSTDVSEHYLAAVTNVFTDYHLERPGQLGIDDPAAYFNAGVLVLNLALMRQDRCSAAMRDYAVANADRLLFRDQDALNVVLHERRLALHPRWNMMNSVAHFPWALYAFGARALAEARAAPAIRHFEGPGANKPWHFLTDDASRDLYLRHRRQTPWPDFVPDEWTRRNRVRRARSRIRRRLGA